MGSWFDRDETDINPLILSPVFPDVAMYEFMSIFVVIDEILFNFVLFET